MALSNYTELQTAIQSELDRSSAPFTAATPDFIRRAEAKMNRRLRLRTMEIQKTANYLSSNTERRIEEPDDMLEMLDLWIKPSTAADSEYYPLKQVAPFNLPRYYNTNDVVAFSMRNDIEFNHTVSADHTVKMHYIKKLDLATDSTNWVLTNFPDAYLYGSLVEAEAFLVNDARISIWKTLFEEALAEMNELDQRSRNDAELDNPVARIAGRRAFNIIRGI